jgi:hypothetical protein
MNWIGAALLLSAGFVIWIAVRRNRRPKDRPSAVEMRIEIKGDDIILHPLDPNFRMYNGEILSLSERLNCIWDGRVVQCRLTYDPKYTAQKAKEYGIKTGVLTISTISQVNEEDGNERLPD